MPTLTICNTPGCGALIPHGRGYCDQHRTQAYLHKTTTTAARRARDGRNRAAWQHIRSQVLTRAGHVCELHHPGCTIHATHAHRTRGGYHDATLDEYQAACAHCHGLTHAHHHG